MPPILQRVKPGDPISAARYNELQRLVEGLLTGSGADYYQDSQGIHIRPKARTETTRVQIVTGTTTAAFTGAVIDAFTANTLHFLSTPTIDGLTPSTGNLWLIKNQTGATAKLNGVYVVGEDEGGGARTWTRWEWLIPGMSVHVISGTRNSGSVWILATPDPITIGTTSITFTNRSIAEYCNVKAAQASGAAATPCDGQAIASGERVLVLTGASAGVWEYDGAAFSIYLGIPLSVVVQAGTTYGRLIAILDTGGTTYNWAQAVWG